MTLQFSSKPGPRERQLKRKYQNPLFPHVVIEQAAVDPARMADSMDSEDYLHRFRELVEETVSLPTNIDADDILKLKARLEQSYTRCVGLGGDMDPIKQGLIKLLEVMMQALIKAANGDAEAMQRIDQEMEMMKLHFQLSESQLFSDFLHQDNIIAEDEVIPTLLSSSTEDLKAVLHIFTPEQLQTISAQITTILPQWDLNQSQLRHYQKQADMIDQWLHSLSADH